MRTISALIILTMANVGCASSGGALSDAAFVALVAETVRVDDDFGSAQRALEQRGFRCGWIVVDPIPPTPSPEPNRIYCHLEELQHLQGCRQRVQLTREQGRVSRIELEVSRVSQFPRKGTCIAR
jgi:hypothetical protein